MSFYDNMMFYPTTLALSFPEPLMIGAVLLLLWVGATVGMRKWERAMGLDPFADPHRPKEEDEEEIVGEPNFLNEEEKKLYELQEKSREEQLERIRQMFSHMKEEENEENEENEEDEENQGNNE